TFIALFYILLGTIKSYFVLRRFKPDIVIGSGGYVAAPVLFAASLLKLKVFIHEQNAVPGRLNRFVARVASRIGVSFSSTAHYFPEDKVVVTGYPLRKSIRFSKDENIKEKYNIPEKNKVVFIFGGSGGARSINTALAEIIPMLLAIDGLTVILSTGRGYSSHYKAFDDTLKILRDGSVPDDVEGRLIIKEYFDNIDEIYSISDLIVSRAGAGTIKEITTLGIPSILIPKINLPGDHQILNAREVEKIGGAKVVYESVTFKDNKQEIYVPEQILHNTIRDTLFDGDTLFNMRKNLRQVEKKNSTELILKELEVLMKGKEKPEETQVKVFYLHSQEDEKNIELLFDTTSIGNSYWCDAFLDGVEETTLVELKVLKKKSGGSSGNGHRKTVETIIARRLKGALKVDGEPVEKWVELKEDSRVAVGKEEKTFVLKSYHENVQTVHIEKSTTSKVLGSSFGIMFSRLGGFVREAFIAAKFGLGQATDIFAIGLAIANLMRRVVAENAMENAFLPIFMRLFHRTSRKKTWEAVGSIVNFTLLLSFVSTVLLVIFTPVLIQQLFPSFAATPAAVTLTRLILPYLFLVTIAAVMTTFLKAFNRFGIAEASSVFFSVGTVTGILLFYSTSGLYSLAYGVLLGGLLQILILVPILSRIFRIKALEYSYKPVINFNSPANKKYYSQLGPIAADVFLGKANDLVGIALASRLPIEGAVSFLYFSLTIYRLPFAIISQAINSVILKEFSNQIALFDVKKAKQLFVDGVKTNLFLLAPISVLLVVLAEPIVSILYERGSFDAANAANTAFALKFYSIGLIGWGVHSLTVRIFSARIDIKTSMILNLFMLLVNVGLSFYLVTTSLSFAGLALATSVSFLLFSFIRVAVLKVKLEKEDISIKFGEFLFPLYKTLIATTLMVIVLGQAKFIFNGIEFASKPVGNIVMLVSLAFIGISVYLLASMLLKNTELLIFKSKLRKKNGAVPISMLSPFKFLEVVSKDRESYKDDYFYKINIYLASGRWEVRNVGIKLVGLFKDATKVGYLLSVLKSRKENGFVKRNALNSLRQLNPWNPDIKNLMLKMLADPYYEVRAATLYYLSKNSSAKDYLEYKATVHRCLHKGSLEEKLACLKLIAKIGSKEELESMEPLYLGSNSLIREELLELLYGFYRRKLLAAEELKEHIGRILITSNNLNPEFKLKSIVKKIYKEIE
ncbi:MAG: murein biosynthesis integral membrane protein MurJ, partial [bacterium]|nr:murein biosynthesis integral membrane protein MurJ [bacterium]